MASLLPLLHDLLPMIIPSEPHVVRGDEPAWVEERAETPPWHHHQRPSPAAAPKTTPGMPSAATAGTGGGGGGAAAAAAAGGAGAGSTTSSTADSGSSALLQPIQLFDHEDVERPVVAAVPSRAHHEEDASPGATPPPHQSRQAGGPKVYRQDALVGVTDKMCVTDTIIFAAHGQGVLLTSPAVDAVRALRADIKGEQLTRDEERPRRLDLSPGDFAFIPAWTEHQVVNERQDDHIRWVVLRSGGKPLQVDLSTWGGKTLP